MDIIKSEKIKIFWNKVECQFNIAFVRTTASKLETIKYKDFLVVQKNENTAEKVLNFVSPIISDIIKTVTQLNPHCSELNIYLEKDASGKVKIYAKEYVHSEVNIDKFESKSRMYYLSADKEDILSIFTTIKNYFDELFKKRNQKEEKYGYGPNIESGETNKSPSSVYENSVNQMVKSTANSEVAINNWITDLFF